MAGRPTLRVGSKSGDVIFLQRRLNLNGAALVEDGDFGLGTKAAVQTFQRSRARTPNGVVGPATWTALEATPRVRVPRGRRGSAAVPPPRDLRTAPVGPFAPFVTRGLISRDIAALFHDLFVRIPGNTISHEVASFVLQELGNGNLIAAVSVADAPGILPILPRRLRAQVSGNRPANGGNFTPVRVQRVTRGIIVFADAQLVAARRPGPGRDLTQLMVVHELNHHRNRIQAERLRRTQITSRQFTNVRRALFFRTPHSTVGVREVYIAELAARHIAWHVQSDRRRAAGRRVRALTPGRFYNAAAHFFRTEPPAYLDNGYGQFLSTQNPDEPFRRQVGLWMRELAKMEFHRSPAENLALRAFFEAEFQHVSPAFPFNPNARDGIA